MELEPQSSPDLRGRLLVAAAAVMWSSSGLFAKAATFDEWPVESRGLLLAFWRALFAALFLLPFVRRPRWNWRLVPMGATFTLMNVTYLSAMSMSTAANAIWLQSTAPLWIFASGLLFGAEKFNRRDLTPLVCAALGVAIILANEIGGEASLGVAFGLLSGLFYAGVVLSIRGLRAENSAWLVAFNHLVAAACLLPFVFYRDIWPTWPQLAALAAFGILQMGLPYVLFARGLKNVTSQEATLIGLLEPVLVPFWAYFSRGERPADWTLAGAALILAGLAFRYRRRSG